MYVQGTLNLEKMYSFSNLARPHFQEEIEEIPSSTIKPRFVPTKWESIDPTQVAAQGKILRIRDSRDSPVP
jgi:hypothetical protein